MGRRPRPRVYSRTGAGVTAASKTAVCDLLLPVMCLTQHHAHVFIVRLIAAVRKCGLPTLPTPSPDLTADDGSRLAVVPSSIQSDNNGILQNSSSLIISIMTPKEVLRIGERLKLPLPRVPPALPLPLLPGPRSALPGGFWTAAYYRR